MLIVEDNTELTDLYEAWLGDEYDVRIAHDGTAALELLDDAVDIVLLDRRIPGISGDEVLERIRSQGSNCRVVIISAVTPDFDIISMGFDGYVTKPVGREEFLETIERMRRRAAYDEDLQRYYQLLETDAALRESMPATELEGNEAFQELQDELAALRATTDDIVDEFGQDECETASGDLDRVPDHPGDGD